MVFALGLVVGSGFLGGFAQGAFCKTELAHGGISTIALGLHNQQAPAAVPLLPERLIHSIFPRRHIVGH
jgi:hypothetical protein